MIGLFNWLLNMSIDYITLLPKCKTFHLYSKGQHISGETFSANLNIELLPDQVRVHII
jgi:hypothetical protein